MTAALVAPHDGSMADDPAARPRRRRFSPEYNYGTAPQIRAHRAIVLDRAYAANPQRFARPPTPPRLPTIAWINQPTPEALIQTR